MDTNVVVLSGYLGQNPEVRMTSGGQQVATLNLAVNESYSSNGQRHNKTYWFKVVCWGKTAEIAGKYMSKGSRVEITGKLTQRSWEGTDGKKNYSTEVVCSNLNMVNTTGKSGQERADASGRTDQEPSSGGYDGGYDDDVPF